MDTNSKFDFHNKLLSYLHNERLSKRLVKILEPFYASYMDTIQKEHPSFIQKYEDLFSVFLDLVSSQFKNPYLFPAYHQQVRSPFDYYAFGLEFLRPLVDLSSSTIRGKENLKQIQQHLKEGHNVIFLANHQIEADPQAIALLFEKEFSQLSKQMIFVAGERVTIDPTAIPFSLGCNLICIYSKRYIDHPPEQKPQKQLHNQKTMQLVSQLLSEGSKCIYVAPSGGRDRKNTEGIITPAPFDPQSIEMFYLMAKKAKKATYFYPMALSTYDLLPPPETVQLEIGEKRSAKRTAIHLAIGSSVDMEHFPGSSDPNKHMRRKARANYIWDLVNQDYQRLL